MKEKKPHRDLASDEIEPFTSEADDQKRVEALIQEAQTKISSKGVDILSQNATAIAKPGYSPWTDQAKGIQK